MPAEPTAAFYAKASLNTEIYDARTAVHIAGSPVEGDVAFYRDEARRFGGPVLEVGRGTGRVAFPLADDGHEVVGTDLSAPMLRLADRRAASLPPGIQARLRFQQADMTDFSLGREFALIVMPFRSCQFALTSEAQRAALLAMRRHLRADGGLILDLFDPRLDWCVPAEALTSPRRGEVRHPTTGNRVIFEVVERRPDPHHQLIREVWRTTEVGPDGMNLRTELETLTLRWTLRSEMRYLLELTGFEVVAEYGDFAQSPPTYGREQIWVVRRAD